MKRQPIWKCGVAAMLFSLTAGGMSGAALAEENTPAQAAAQQEAVKPAGEKPFIAAVHAGHALGMHHPVLQRHFWQLMTAAYAPELAEEWEAALEERKAWEERFAKQVGNVLIYKGSLPQDAKVPAPSAAAEGEAKTYVYHLDDDEAGKAVPVEGPKPAGDVLRIKKFAGTQVEKAELSPEAKRLVQLAEAIEAGDEETIRGLMSALLEDYRQQTAEIKAEWEKIKEREEQAK